MITVGITPEGRRTLDLVYQWKARTKAFQAQLVYLTAQWMYDELKEKIPKTSEWREYRNSLEMAKVVSVAPVFAVRSNARRADTREVDGSQGVLYIERRRRMAKVSPALTVLEKYQPWTVDTLPFTPAPNEASLVFRRVSRREVASVRGTRRRQRRLWGTDLARLGVRIGTDLRSRRVAVEATPDVSFEGLRLEFGGGETRAKPHWRPTIGALKRGKIKEVYKANPALRLALTRVSFSPWRKWPHRTKKHISVREARNLIAFQRMVLAK